MEAYDYEFEEFMEDGGAFSIAQIQGGADSEKMAWPYFRANYRPEERAKEKLKRFWEIRSFLHRNFAALGCPFDENGYSLPVNVCRAAWAVFATKPSDAKLTDGEACEQVLAILDEAGD